MTEPNNKNQTLQVQNFQLAGAKLDGRGFVEDLNSGLPRIQDGA